MEPRAINSNRRPPESEEQTSDQKCSTHQNRKDEPDYTVLILVTRGRAAEQQQQRSHANKRKTETAAQSDAVAELKRVGHFYDT